MPIAPQVRPLFVHRRPLAAGLALALAAGAQAQDLMLEEVIVIA